MSEQLVKESLELMLENVERKIVEVELQLLEMAKRFGIRDWKELEEAFTSKGIDSPELDLLWPEFKYLKDKLEGLKKRKEELLELLGRAP